MSTMFLDLARRGHRLPMVTDLYLQECKDPESARRDGKALAGVIGASARDWNSPLAVPLMDLKLEKADMLACLGLGEAEADHFHFDAPLSADQLQALTRVDAPPCPPSQARDEALRILSMETPLFSIGMAIGPFSLTTKLLADPITAAALYAGGIEPADEPQVRMLLELLERSTQTVLRSIERQIQAGARAVMLCEPAANTSFLSPRQIRAGSNVFEELVITPNLKVKRLLERHGAALFFHDCGELIPEMVHAFGHQLRPDVLSLGSSRSLPDDAQLVPKNVVLYGNLPSKFFYSDARMSLDDVIERTERLVREMSEVEHPHILGTECDVLNVPEAAETIRRKVEAMRGPAPR